MRIRVSTNVMFTVMIILAAIAGVLWAMSNPLAIALAAGSFVLGGVVSMRGR